MRRLWTTVAIAGLLTACSPEEASETPTPKPKPAATGSGTGTGTGAGTGTGTGTTSNVGPEFPVAGDVFEFDLNAGEWTEPPGMGDLIGGLFGDMTLLMAVTGVADTLDTTIATADQVGMQDRCIATNDVAFDYTTEPDFGGDVGTLEMGVEGIPIFVEALTMSGMVAPNGSAIGNGVFDGEIDWTGLTDLIGDDPCDLLITFGIACQPCPSGMSITCTPIRVEELQGVMTNAQVVTRTPADIAADAQCP